MYPGHLLKKQDIPCFAKLIKLLELSSADLRKNNHRFVTVRGWGRGLLCGRDKQLISTPPNQKYSPYFFAVNSASSFRYFTKLLSDLWPLNFMMTCAGIPFKNFNVQNVLLQV